MEWNMEEKLSMEWNMEENFSMEWNMEWKKISGMEYGKIVFHSIPNHALLLTASFRILLIVNLLKQSSMIYKSKIRAKYNYKNHSKRLKAQQSCFVLGTHQLLQ